MKPFFAERRPLRLRGRNFNPEEDGRRPAPSPDRFRE